MTVRNRDKSNNCNQDGGSKRNSTLQQENELSVCDVMGEWGRYQWSLSMFSTIYSALAGMTVVLGPILTPDIAHVCDHSLDSLVTNASALDGGLEVARRQQQVDWSNFSAPPHECFSMRDGQLLMCQKYLYDEADSGQMLTNHFDLVCDREWLRALPSSASLLGMLISSVTLGLVSDRFGRLRCTQLGCLVAILANLVAILAHDYYLFNICILLMSFAQVGASNALCTLLMEAVSPRLRSVAIFLYGAGWALGTALVPVFHHFSHDYQVYFGAMLVWQLLMLPWLHWGVFESIRWLLSEGHINRAQIELRRACKMNRVQTDAKLAQSIRQLQVQQVRKASRVIEDELAPARLARALECELSSTTQELDMLSAAIKRSFGLIDDDDEKQVVERECAEGVPNLLSDHLSPTLARKSFSIPIDAPTTRPADEQIEPDHALSAEKKSSSNNNNTGRPVKQMFARNSLVPPTLGADKELDLDTNRKQSLSTQALIQLAMKYSKTVQQADEGNCFLVQMFHRKLWRQTIVLMLVSIMYETSYYGFIQSTKHVGNNISMNYLTSSASECLAALVSCFTLAMCSRKFSLIFFTLLGSACCFAMALTYHLIPDARQQRPIDANGTTLLDSQLTQSSHLSTPAPLEFGGTNVMRESRQWINLVLMLVGRFVISVGAQIAATVALESYPNNLRQTALGAIVFMGRICSIIAPFLFNDTSEDKLILKSTLAALGLFGFAVCIIIPATLRDRKDKELCDRMNEIED